MANLIQMGTEDSWIIDDDEIGFSTHEELERAIDCWNNGNYDLAETILQKISVNNKNHIDALHHLSLVYEDSSREFEAYLCCREAVRVGMSLFPKEFVFGQSQLEWYSLSNRPFLRAYYNLGLWLQRRGEAELAIEIFSNMLVMSPNDNIGVRYILPQLFFEKDDVSSVVSLCEQYSDEIAPELIYSYPLALIIRGEFDVAKPLLKEAKKQLPLVAKELLKNTHTRPKSKMPGYISHGGLEQAYQYWESYGVFWKANKKALNLLKA